MALTGGCEDYGWKALAGRTGLPGTKGRGHPVPVGAAQPSGTHPHHGVEAQSRMRRLHVGEEHPPHPRVALAQDLAGTLHGTPG